MELGIYKKVDLFVATRLRVDRRNSALFTEEEIVLSELINIREYPVKDVLGLLLKDKTTGKNIIWATDAYISNGLSFSDKSQINRAAGTDAEEGRGFHTGLAVQPDE